MSIEALRFQRDRILTFTAQADAARAERDELLAQLARKGMTYRELAIEAGISFQAVAKIIRAAKNANPELWDGTNGEDR